MSVHGEPYIPASQSPLELTTRVIVVGILLGILMTAANAYLGLYAGMFRPNFNTKEFHTIITVSDVCFIRVYA